MSIFVRARFEVRNQRETEFEEVALALLEQANGEPGTLTFRWFRSDDGSYLVLEEYADSPAAVAHNERAGALLERVAQYADMLDAEVYGDISPEIGEWIRANPQVKAYADSLNQHTHT